MTSSINTITSPITDSSSELDRKTEIAKNICLIDNIVDFVTQTINDLFDAENQTENRIKNKTLEPVQNIKILSDYNFKILYEDLKKISEQIRIPAEYFHTLSGKRIETFIDLVAYKFETKQLTENQLYNLFFTKEKTCPSLCTRIIFFWNTEGTEIDLKFTQLLQKIASNNEIKEKITHALNEKVADPYHPQIYLQKKISPLNRINKQMKGRFTVSESASSAIKTLVNAEFISKQRPLVKFQKTISTQTSVKNTYTKEIEKAKEELDHFIKLHTAVIPADHSHKEGMLDFLFVLFGLIEPILEQKRNELSVEKQQQDESILRQKNEECQQKYDEREQKESFHILNVVGEVIDCVNAILDHSEGRASDWSSHDNWQDLGRSKRTDRSMRKEIEKRKITNKITNIFTPNGYDPDLGGILMGPTAKSMAALAQRCQTLSHPKKISTSSYQNLIKIKKFDTIDKIVVKSPVQNPETCVLDASELMRSFQKNNASNSTILEGVKKLYAGVTESPISVNRYFDINNKGSVNPFELTQAIVDNIHEKGMGVLVAYGISAPESQYKEKHHAVNIVDIAEVNERYIAIIIDRDDTTPDKNNINSRYRFVDLEGMLASAIPAYGKEYNHWAQQPTDSDGMPLEEMPLAPYYSCLKKPDLEKLTLTNEEKQDLHNLLKEAAKNNKVEFST